MKGGNEVVVTRRRFLKSAAAFVGIGVAGSLVAACGGQQAPAAPTAAPAAPTQAAAPTPAAAPAPTEAPKVAVSGEKKLAVWAIKLFTQAPNDLCKEQISKYATDKGWQVEITDTPTDVMPKLMAGIESGEVPDLVQLGSEVPQLYATEALADVTDVVNDLIGQYGQPVKLIERGGNFQGKWAGIPWFMYADAFFARQDVLDAAGVKLESPFTFDQARDTALQLSEPDKQLWGWGMTIKNGSGDGDILARHVLNSFGGSVTDESGQKVILNSPESVEAVRWLTEIYTSPKYAKMLPQGVLGWGGGSNNENFLGGKIIFTQNASSLYWAMKTQNNPYRDKTTLLQFPKGPKHELMGGYPYYHLTFKKSKNRDFAIEVGKHQAMTEQVVARTTIAEGASWPVFEKHINEPKVQDYIKADKNRQQLFKNCSHVSGWSVGWPAQPNPATAAVEVQYLLAKMYESAIGGTSPEEAVKNTHQQCVTIFEQFGMKQ